MKTMQEKYNQDNAYRDCVDAMEAVIHQNQFTPSEMREMAVLACIHYEMRRPMPHYIKVPGEVDNALNILNDFRTKNNNGLL